MVDEDRSKFEALFAELWNQFQPEKGLTACSSTSSWDTLSGCAVHQSPKEHLR